jgi:hypothetical protein
MEFKGVYGIRQAAIRVHPDMGSRRMINIPNNEVLFGRRIKTKHLLS